MPTALRQSGNISLAQIESLSCCQWQSIMPDDRILVAEKFMTCVLSGHMTYNTSPQFLLGLDRGLRDLVFLISAYKLFHLLFLYAYKLFHLLFLYACKLFHLFLYARKYFQLLLYD